MRLASTLLAGDKPWQQTHSAATAALRTARTAFVVTIGTTVVAGAPPRATHEVSPLSDERVVVGDSRHADFNGPVMTHVRVGRGSKGLSAEVLSRCFQFRHSSDRRMANLR